MITPEEALPFLEKLPITAFHGIGKVTAEKMRRMGIFNGANLKQYSEVELVRRFGKVGRHYFHIVRAEDERAVNPNRIRKSIGAERTYKTDITDLSEMKEKLSYLAEVVYKYMEKADNFGRTVTIKAKMPDFRIITRSRTFSTEVRSLAGLAAIAHELLDENKEDISSVRLLGLSLSNLSKEQAGDGIQLEFDFEPPKNEEE